MELGNVLDITTRTRVPVLIWGPPGVGKSAAILHWATTRTLPCWTVIASLRDPSDFGGLPVIQRLEEPLSLNGCTVPSVSFAPPRFAVEAAIHGGVIFLDELTTAPPAVQAALLRAVLDAAFGDLQLPRDRVAIVAAANPPEVAAGGWDLAAPLANRFLHLQFSPKAEDWVTHFPDYWGFPPELSYQGQTVDETRWARARTVVAAFIRARPVLLLQVPLEDGRRGGAWPSPRTWDFASRILACTSASVSDLSDALPLLAGCVGDGPALELVAWLRDLDLPDPEELLTHPESYRHPNRSDQAYAVLDAVVRAALERTTPERWLAAWRVLATAASAGGADVAAAAARRLALARRGDLPLPKRELALFLPILQAAGLIAGRAGA